MEEFKAVNEKDKDELSINQYANDIRVCIEEDDLTIASIYLSEDQAIGMARHILSIYGL